MAGAMIFGTDAISAAPDVVLPTGNDYWFWNGNGTTINGTDVPDYWLNKVGAEIEQAYLLLAGALGVGSPAISMTNRNQVGTLLATLAGIAVGAATPASVAAAIAAALGLPREIAVPGYYTLPGGLIIQWGFSASAQGGGATVHFPIAFPNACFIVLATNSVLSSANHVNANINSSSGFQLSNSDAGGGFTDSAYWLAIGN